MKAGDLVKWDYAEGMAKVGVLLGKWSSPHPDDTTPYWSVFMGGQTYNLGEQYLEVIHESR